MTQSVRQHGEHHSRNLWVDGTQFRAYFRGLLPILLCFSLTCAVEKLQRSVFLVAFIQLYLLLLSAVRRS